MKVETYLRLAGISYEVINGELPLKAPKLKLPYFEDETKVIADSGFILDYLKLSYGDIAWQPLALLRAHESAVLRTVSLISVQVAAALMKLVNRLDCST